MPDELPGPDDPQSESTVTVILAFAANALIAIAKTVAAVITGSASMVAEAAHSWADTGNEILLLIANRRSNRSPDARHPLGYGRDAYVWSMFAALGLFAVGAGVSITHGINELLHPEPATDYLIAYIVLAIAFVLEGISFRQAFRQTRDEAKRVHRDVLQHAFATSDPTVRAVFAEDSAALIGLIIAAAGVAVHQLTGFGAADAIGSIAVGVLLGVVSVILIGRNRRFLLGEEASGVLREAALRSLLEQPEVDRVTYLRMEYLGPRQVFLIAALDLMGNEPESTTSIQLAELRHRIESSHPQVRKAFLSLSAPDEPALEPADLAEPAERAGQDR